MKQIGTAILNCKYCGGNHVMETRYLFYCPKVFGGWVNLRKRKPAKKIVGYRKSFTLRLDDQWEWDCPVWFTQGIFANAIIKGTRTFDTQAEAVADMDAQLKLFGITKRTKNLNITR